MIKVKVKNDLITISGHANYSDYGKDIVCASVSSMIYTTVNAILNFDDKAIIFKDDDPMEIKIVSKDEATLKLIDNMICLLEDLEKQYPDNLKISKGE